MFLKLTAKLTRPLLFVLLSAAFLIAVLIYTEFSATKVPPRFDEIEASYKKSDAFLLDRHGVVIHEMRVSEKGRRLDWIGMDNISPALVKAVCRVEDRRFFEHGGVDWPAVLSAALKNPFSSKTRGASTITMQLASLLDKSIKPKAARRTLLQKKDQMLAAFALEKTWSKQQIIEAYLNLISYRGELQGIAAASRGLFDKDPSGLNEAESCILAALITSPNSPIDEITKRACLAGRTSSDPNLCADIGNTARERLGIHYAITPSIADAPHVARILLKSVEGGQTSVRSTLDGRLQRFAAGVLNQQISALSEDHVFDGAVLVAENRTGEILAYLGNSGRSSSAPHVDGIISLRQAGSTLKPFLYELAIEKRFLTAASIIDDSPLNIPTPTGLYVPQNYDKVFRGEVSVRSALSASMNVPAVKTLLLVGVNDFHSRLKKLGFASLTRDAEFYGYSLALGSADISLYELVNACRALANSGVWSGMRLSFEKAARRPRRVMDTNACFIITSILSDREARSATFGLENPLSTRFWTAVKTGTSKDMRDNWCVGFSERYTVGVWVGNFSGAPMRNVSGVTGAAPVWLELMNYLHASEPSRPPQPPVGVIAKKTSLKGMETAAAEEYFIKGTEPVAPFRLSGHHKPKIVYPVNDMVIAIDPEIPEKSQLVPFQFEPEVKKYRWRLHDKDLGAGNIILWRPEAGKYNLAIVDEEGQVLDAVKFLVR